MSLVLNTEWDVVLYQLAEAVRAMADLVNREDHQPCARMHKIEGRY